MIGFILGVAAVVLFVPAVVYAVECFLAPREPRAAGGDATARTVVIIPAHDEAGGIGPTVRHVEAMRGPEDRLIVVADNCTDDTADRAREAGAEVLERADLEHRGKGFALNHALAALADAPPDVVLILDADCRLAEGAYATLVAQAHTTGRPAQAEYVMRAADDSAKSALSAFAFLVRNVVRPRGLDRLGFPCHLTGTGMAFPYAALQAVPLQGGHIVEDLVHGLDLVTQGYAPQLCSAARVWSELPEGSEASLQQRSRWEHGQLHTLVTRAGHLMAEGVRRGRADVVALGLDLAVPPLAFFVMLLLAFFVGAAFLRIVGVGPFPMRTAFQALVLVGLGTLWAWWRFGRDVISASQLLAIPGYVLWKIPMYLKLLVGQRTTEWKRTERADERLPDAVDPDRSPDESAPIPEAPSESAAEKAAQDEEEGRKPPTE